MRDLRLLNEREKRLFAATVRKINLAYDEHIASEKSDRIKWPKNSRIRDVEAAAGIWEVTWSFSGPDGRATFDYFTIGSELGIRWRRIGGHEIFGRP